MQTRSPTENGLYRQGDPTDKGPLHTRDPYRQGALTDKEFIQTKGLYSKGPLETIYNSDRQGPGSYRQYGAPIDNYGPFQTIRGHTHNGPLQKMVPYRPEAPTNNFVIFFIVVAMNIDIFKLDLP